MKTHTNFLLLLLATSISVNLFAQVVSNERDIARMIVNNELDSLKLYFSPKDAFELEKFKMRSALSTALDVANENANTDALELLLPLQKEPILYEEYLWNAVYAEKVKSVEFWIKKGVDIDYYYHRLYKYMHTLNFTPLMQTSKSGDLEMSKILLANGADVNKQSVSGLTPLFFAAESGNLELVKYLIEQGADINAVDYRSKNVLMHAAYYGRYNVVDYLLSKDFKVDAVDDYQRTALMMPSMYYYNEMVEDRSFVEREENAYQTTKLLVEKGAKINARDFEGMTTLMFALSNGYLRLVEYLLSNGANPEQKNNFGDVAAAFYNSYYHDSNEELQKQKNKKLRLLLNIKQDDHVTLPPKRKFQPSKDEDLLTALSENNIHKVRKAIEAGASFYPDWEPDFMGSMMSRALNAGISLPILQLLVEKGSYVDDGNYYKTTALMRAAMGNDLKAAEFFIKRGANVNLKNEYKNTALIFAAKEGNVKMIKLLLNHGADPNLMCNYKTALDTAIYYGKTDAAEYLKSIGAKSYEEMEENLK